MISLAIYTVHWLVKSDVLQLHCSSTYCSKLHRNLLQDAVQCVQCTLNYRIRPLLRGPKISAAHNYCTLLTTTRQQLHCSRYYPTTTALCSLLPGAYCTLLTPTRQQLHYSHYYPATTTIYIYPLIHNCSGTLRTTTNMLAI